LRGEDENEQIRKEIDIVVGQRISELVVSVTCRRKIGYNFTGKAMRRRRYAEDRFAVNSRYWSATFNSRLIRLIEKGKQDKELYKGVIMRLLRLSREHILPRENLPRVLFT
jgi:hypothetical protein